MRRILSLLLILLLLGACGAPAAPAPTQENPEPAGTEEPVQPPEGEEEDAPEETGKPVEPEPYEISSPTEAREGYVPWEGIVEHLFFHPVIAYPELAFDGDAQANGLDDFMVTVDEYNKILQSVYEKGYVLVDIADVWSETAGEDGAPKMVRNTLYLPEGKKPLILSYDDTNYYPYMLENGFAD